MLLLSLFAVFVLTACKENKGMAHNHNDTYTCPMHPTVVSDRQGTCPVCGMDLVRKARKGEEIAITDSLRMLLKSPNEAVIASIKTIKGDYKKRAIAFEANGIVTYDTRYTYSIPAKIGGRLEKVFVKYPFQPIGKGEKIAEIYSPELLTAQRELLYIMANDVDNTVLAQSAKERLSLLGASEKQIHQLINRKEVSHTFSIHSPYNGYIINENQQAPTATLLNAPPSLQGSGMDGGMGGASTATSTNMGGTAGNEFFLREGNYVAQGQALFKVVNTTSLRVELSIPAASSSTLKMGDNVLLDINAKQEEARVDFVQPFFNEGEGFSKVRVYTKELENLPVGHVVKATISMADIEALWIPKEAILNIGLDRIVFIKKNGVFIPEIITAGVEYEGWTEVKLGLLSTDEIAANAQYLVDSESFIKINN